MMETLEKQAQSVVDIPRNAPLASVGDANNADILPAGQALRIDLTTMSDDQLQTFLMDAMQERMDVAAFYKRAEDTARAEFLRRLQERGAKAIPVSDSRIEKIELEETYEPYVYDVQALRDACVLLQDDTERAKIVKHETAWTEIIEHPDQYVAGAAVSITATKKKYAGTEIASLLDRGMHRASLGPKLAFKMKK